MADRDLRGDSYLRLQCEILEKSGAKFEVFRSQHQ